jgi:hypothetical protein
MIIYHLLTILIYFIVYKLGIKLGEWLPPQTIDDIQADENIKEAKRIINPKQCNHVYSKKR